MRQLTLNIVDKLIPFCRKAPIACSCHVESLRRICYIKLAGIALMATFAMLRLVKTASPCEAFALGAVVALLALFWVAAPIFHGLGNFNLLIFFVGVVAATVFAGVPIAFAFGLAVFGYLALTTLTPLTVLVGRMDEGMSHLILLAVPLFVFLGLLIEMTGIARAMVAFLASLLGPMRGGLHYVLLAGMYLISGISGSKAADMAAIAPALFPEMERLGNDRNTMTALLAATGRRRKRCRRA
jgi:Tripartite ATP-independent periplasmic transporter, DctM component